MTKASARSMTFTGWVSDLARTHAQRLAGIARREGLAAHDALDAVQEAFHTFLLLPQARSLVLEEEESHKLLSVLTRNVARNMRRRHHRSRPHAELGEAEVASDDRPAVDELMVMAEDHLLILGCVNKLADIQRRVVTLRMLEQVSGLDVARELELTPGHVSVLLHRAKEQLLECVSS
jgi:RNA polymerase sigma-70 factor (ECF subfamily)